MVLRKPTTISPKKGYRFFLFYNIFFFGEVIYSDGFVEKVRQILISRNPKYSIYETFKIRVCRIQYLKQLILRNLQRILADSIWIRLYLKEGRIVPFEELVNEALKTKVIDKDEYYLFKYIEKLKKLQEYYDKFIPLTELHEMEIKVYKIVNIIRKNL